MSAFADFRTALPQQIWEGVVARTVHGERVTFGLVELDADVVIPEHSHENEQAGMVIEGTLTFTIAGDSREVGPGQAWCITAHVPHTVTAGPAGAVVVEVFSPGRADWAALEPAGRRTPRWP